METTIYYFSATGNSYYLASSLANKLENCKITSMVKAVKANSIEVNTPKVGFVFPVYAWGMPRIVEEFVNKIVIPKESYVFAIVTCVAIPGNTLKDLSKLLHMKGNRLQVGYVTKSGRSSLMKLNSLDKVIMLLDTQRGKIRHFEERLPEFVNDINNKVKRSPETSNRAASVFGSFFHKMGISAFKTIDSQFTVSEECTQCGTCVKVCPRNNIELKPDGPTFMHNCELCHACIQWCPKFAIRHPNFDDEPKQYRNCNVRVSEIIGN